MKSITISVFLLTLLMALSTSAGTQQNWGKWKKGELLLEDHSFEEAEVTWNLWEFENCGQGFASTFWVLDDGTCCGRGGLYTVEIDKKNPQHGKQSLKIVGHKATGIGWHAKIKQWNTSMKSGETYTVIFWARSEKPRTVSLSVQMQQEPWTFYQGGAINLLGPEWMEYHITFQSGSDVDRDMWVGLAIAQSDVDFWIDNFRYFKGEPEDDLNRDTPFRVDAKEKLATQWGTLKSERF